MGLPLEDVFVFRQVFERDHFGYGSTVWALNLHHVWSLLASQLNQACCAEGVPTLEDPGNFVLSIVWKSTDLAFYRLPELFKSQIRFLHVNFELFKTLLPNCCFIQLFSRQLALLLVLKRIFLFLGQGQILRMSVRKLLRLLAIQSFLFQL